LRLDKDKWQKAFEKELEKAEKRQSSKVRRYYKNQYYKGAESFLSSGQTSFQLLFSTSELIKIYRDLYSDIGLQFAKWYSRNFDKYIKKGVNPNQFIDQWANTFAALGSAVGAERVTLVSGTAKATLVKVTQNLLTDIEFQNTGIDEKTRILRSQFTKYSTFQAQRLVRTEATNAANFATIKSAETIFPAEDLQKEWIAATDERTRPTHRAVNGTVINQTDLFSVGDSLMMYPGDSRGSAKEVINCRCSIAVFPKEGAQTIGEISDINFGLGGGTRTGYGLGDFVADVGATVASGVQDAKESMRPDAWSKIVPKNAKVNDNYLSLLKERPKLQSSNNGSYASGNTIVIDTKRFNSDTIGRVLAHEFGHVIHKQREWVLLSSRKYRSIDEVVSFYKSQRKKIGINKRGEEKFKYFNHVDKFSWNHKNSIRKQFPDLTDKQFTESYAAVADYFGAMTKNKVGWGHSNGYYRSEGWRHAEMLAHAFENKYQGNLVFKKLFPEIYEDTIKWIDELINL
jgi:SPP1 gp7 family putative phage head morphogenesis protein